MSMFTAPAYSTEPVIDCQNNISCPAEPLEEITNQFFRYRGVTINPIFRVSKCIGPPQRAIVDLEEIRILGDNQIPFVEIGREVIKWILVNATNLFGIEPFTDFELHIKMPGCVENDVIQWWGSPLTTWQACESSPCCTSIIYASLLSQFVVINNIGNYNWENVCLVGPLLECRFACDAINFLVPQEIPYNTYLTEELCELDCFWRLDGNNNTSNDNFIGPTNGENFVVKTKNTLANDLIHRIVVDNDSRIDFHMNQWKNCPMISFDAEPTGATAGNPPILIEHEPIIKLYRSTGHPAQGGGFPLEGTYPAFTWWISAGQINGQSGYGPLNIWGWSGDENSYYPGQEAPYMIKRLSILGNGNVGIGVEEPLEKLVVDGTICAKEVRVSLSGAPCWPDKVFDADYKLPDISEIATYIKENKHLPGIPTSSEIEQNGLELGDMQAKLLQKIEELTLYVIELKKENEELNKKLNELKEGDKK